jgi:hypothetical protein
MALKKSKRRSTARASPPARLPSAAFPIVGVGASAAHPRAGYRMVTALRRRAGMENRLIYELGAGQWNLPKLRELLENVLPARTTIEDLPLETDFPRIGRKSLRLNARRLANRKGGDDWLLLAVQDVTGRN